MIPTKTLHFHFSGIGGAAMAPLAGMLAESGRRVTGSDAGVYPPASTLLESSEFDEERIRCGESRSSSGHCVHRQCALRAGIRKSKYVSTGKIPFRSLPQTIEEFFLPAATLWW